MNEKENIEADEVYVAGKMRQALACVYPLLDCGRGRKPDEAIKHAEDAAFPALTPPGIFVRRIPPLGLLFAITDRFVGDPREKYSNVWAGLNDEQRTAVALAWLDWLTLWERCPVRGLPWPPRGFYGYTMQTVLDGVAYVAPQGTPVFEGEIIWVRSCRWSRSPFNASKVEPPWLAWVLNKLNEV